MFLDICTEYEEPIIIALQKHTNKHLMEFMRIVSDSIFTRYTAFIIIIAFMFNLITFKQLGAIVFINILLHLLKKYFYRERPYMNNKNIKIFCPTIKYLHDNDNYSFPSAHTTFSFLIYFILKDNNVINSYFIIIPIFISISRVFLGAHYLSDIIFGGLLAKLVSLLI
jgi:undecaprenyl-diphosphatase